MCRLLLYAYAYAYAYVYVIPISICFLFHTPFSIFSGCLGVDAVASGGQRVFHGDSLCVSC